MESTSPYSFQGHGESALELLEAAREASGLGIITEVRIPPISIASRL